MTIEKLREVRDAKPFKAFTVVMADGTRYRVTSPEMIFVPPKAQRTFMLAEGEEFFAFVDLLLVTAFEFGNKRNGTSSNGNGTSRRGKR